MNLDTQFYIPVLDLKVQSALNFAAYKHKMQCRKGTSVPYIVHPFSVASILMGVTNDIDVICAGILHDTIEDTDTLETDILNVFGERVLSILKEAQEDDKSNSWEDRKQHTIDSLKDITYEGSLVVAADKLHNLSTILLDLRLPENPELLNDYWSRFNRGKDKQEWYYGALVTGLKNRGFENPLVNKLESVYNLVFESEVSC